MQIARTVMQAVSRDYGCFTSAGRCRRCRRSGAAGWPPVIFGGPAGPRGARAPRWHRRRDLAGRHQIRIRRTGRASALHQYSRVTRDLDRGGGPGWMLVMRTLTGSQAQRGWAQRTGGKINRGRGGDRRRDARDHRVRRADRRIGWANC